MSPSSEAHNVLKPRGTGFHSPHSPTPHVVEHEANFFNEAYGCYRSSGFLFCRCKANVMCDVGAGGGSVAGAVEFRPPTCQCVVCLFKVDPFNPEMYSLASA